MYCKRSHLHRKLKSGPQERVCYIRLLLYLTLLSAKWTVCRGTWEFMSSAGRELWGIVRGPFSVSSAFRNVTYGFWKWHTSTHTRLKLNLRLNKLVFITRVINQTQFPTKGKSYERHCSTVLSEYRKTLFYSQTCLFPHVCHVRPLSC